VISGKETTGDLRAGLAKMFFGNPLSNFKTRSTAYNEDVLNAYFFAAILIMEITAIQVIYFV